MFVKTLNQVSPLLEAKNTLAWPILAALLSFLVAANCAPNSSAPSGKPHWHRPGCYQVGHTRTISIPGCVKFNLSTNACRGYCMSFSMPATEDIGPGLRDEQPDGLAEPMELELVGGNNVDAQLATNERRRRTDATSAGANRRRLDRLMTLLEPEPAGEGKTRERRQQLEQLIQLGVASSSLPVNSGEKRDVISVGQCCNMMETEEVTVNLRCGFNETRRLVFKSAKTCECFFCKHV